MSFKTILNIYTLFILVSCQTVKLNKVSKRPSWVNNGTNFCEPQGLLCASSEANTLAQADLRAKSELASIFETKIELNLSSTKTLSSNADLLKNLELNEEITKSTRQVTSQLLSGVKIVMREQVGEKFFSLAGIDILMSSKSLRDEIQKHDDRLEFLYAKQSKTDYRKMLEHYYKREAYNKQLSVLSFGKKSPVSLNQIDQLKRSKLKTGALLFLDLSSVDSKIAENVRGYLSGLGYTLVSAGSKYDYKTTAEMKKKKEFLKVEGFTKMTFIISLKNYNSDGVEVGGLSTQHTSIGRDETDAFNKVEPEISKYIENNLYDLRIGE
jgi:hypothetical protein